MVWLCMGFFAYTAIILCSLRLTRLIMHDNILGYEETLTETSFSDPTGLRLFIWRRQTKNHFYNMIYRLITCVWCTSVWTTAVSYVAYLYVPQVVACVALMQLVAILGLLLDKYTTNL